MQPHTKIIQSEKKNNTRPSAVLVDPWVVEAAVNEVDGKVGEDDEHRRRQQHVRPAKLPPAATAIKRNKREKEHWFKYGSHTVDGTASIANMAPLPASPMNPRTSETS